MIDQTVKQLGSVDNPLCSVRGHDTVEIHYGRKGSAHANSDWREWALEGWSRDLRWHSAIENDIVAQQAEPREVGAGVSIYANGARVLLSLGLDDSLRP